MNSKKYFLFSIGLVSLIALLPSCYQKKATKNERSNQSKNEELSLDTIVSGINPDSITYIDTFKLIPTKVIYTQIRKYAKNQITFKLPVFSVSDSLTSQECVEQLAIASVYYEIGLLSKNKKLAAASLKKSKELSSIYFNELDFPKNPTSDSLNAWIKQAFATNLTNKDWVYYEAIQWFENFYLTVAYPKNYIRQKDANPLIILQLDNGAEMLERISMNQEYIPLSKLMEYLINIIDCKYFTLDLNQLREEVIDARENTYLTVKKVEHQ